MCGTITNNMNCATGNAVNSMACEQSNYPSTLTNAVTLASWNPAALAFGFTNGVNSTGGIDFVVEDGSTNSCGNPRAVYVNFVCASALIPGSITVVDNAAGCFYKLTVQTSIVCTPAQLAALAVVPGCQALGYDFSPLAVNLFGISPSGAGYWFHMCGAVTTLPCANPGLSTFGAMGCQLYPSAATPTAFTSIALWNVNTTSFSYSSMYMTTTSTHTVGSRTRTRTWSMISSCMDVHYMDGCVECVCCLVLLDGANYSAGVTLAMFNGVTGCAFEIPRLTYISKSITA
jgi:hypothetical protein